MAKTTIEFGVLNVVAQPHFVGAYRGVLQQAANREVNFWGDLNAAIRAPREVHPGIFQSEIVIGTEIDLRDPLIDRDSFKEVPVEDADVRISEKHLYNGRVFLYTFVEDTHLLFFESRNQFGKTLSPNRAHRIFSQLFSVDVLGPESPYVEVTVIPEDDTLERLLGLERLDKVEIFLQRPNPADVNPSEVQEVLEDLESQGAKSQTVVLTRAPKSKGIELNPVNYVRAKVAQFNGWVRATGVDADGEHFAGSTKSYPKIIKQLVDTATAVTVVAIGVAQRTRIGNQEEPDGD